MTDTSQPAGIVKEAIAKETKDLYLAAAFKADGCRLIDVDKADRTRMVFRFEGGENADRVERQWREESLVLSATAYAHAIRDLKAIVHS